MSRIVTGIGVDPALVLFRYDLRNKRFEDRTLRILESVLVAKDVKSLVDARSATQEVLRSEVVPIMGEITGRDVDEKLRVAEFFVKAFALVGDIESFLAIKYEALVLRELKHMSYPSLQVLFEEWISFARESCNYGFYSIAIKGFDNALLCIHSSNGNTHLQAPLKTEEIIKKIKKHRDMALALTSSHSVQSETAEYIKRKNIQEEQKPDSSLIVRHNPASFMFRYGIKKRNIQKLQERQSMQKYIFK